MLKEGAEIMRICFVSLDYPTKSHGGGGVGVNVYSVAQRMALMGHEVIVVTLSLNGQEKEWKDREVTVIDIVPTVLYKIIYNLPVIKYFSLAIREIEYSFVSWIAVKKLNLIKKIDIVQTTETGALFLALFRKNMVYRFVLRLHGEKYSIYKHCLHARFDPEIIFARLLQRLAIKKADFLLSPSYLHARNITKEIKVDKAIEVYYNHVDWQYVDRVIVERKLNEEFMFEENFVLYAGRLESNKGIWDFVRVAEIVKKTCPKAKFVLIGIWAKHFNKKRLLKFIEEKGLKGSVKIIPKYIVWEDLMLIINRSAVVLYPSHYESFGNIFVEAMTLRKPVLAYNGSAGEEIVEDGINGFVVKKGDTKELARKVEYLLRDKAVRVAMGIKGRERVVKKFSNLVIFPKLYSFYEKTLSLDSQNKIKNIYFSPHLDDVVYSCGGLISQQVARGEGVIVFTVFSKTPKDNPLSAFSCHLHEKWDISRKNIGIREKEDEKACSFLGARVYHANFLEAHYRKDEKENSFYCTYDEMLTGVAQGDIALGLKIENEIKSFLNKEEIGNKEIRLYFPLCASGNVDHCLVANIGKNFNLKGKEIFFYEEWPYVENYQVQGKNLTSSIWEPRVFFNSIDKKVKAAYLYKSQMIGVGGTYKKLRIRMGRQGLKTGEGKLAERFWKLSFSGKEGELEQQPWPKFILVEQKRKLGDFKLFMKGFKWHDLGEVIPRGKGLCLDVGCGDGRGKVISESKGYKWVGLDYSNQSCDIMADAKNIPIISDRIACVISWQMMEYSDSPERIISEVFRVLECGGAFCGSVSFMEPVHGRTFYSISHLMLKELLEKQGFKDIKIIPGVSGFALMVWTWLRRCGTKKFGGIVSKPALLFSGALLAPLAFMVFVVSWFLWRVGLGKGERMEWISKKAPLEFAGHIMFVARKPSAIIR